MIDSPDGFAIDISVFTLIPQERNSSRKGVPDYKLGIVLIVRDNKEEPYHGQLALPGGIKTRHISINDCVLEKMYQKTGIIPEYFFQAGTVDNVGRDPRGWIPVTRFIGATPYDNTISKKPGKFSSAVYIIPIEEILFSQSERKENLAFDHYDAIKEAYRWLIGQIKTSTIVQHFLPNEFTARQLLNVIQVFCCSDISYRNFIRDYIPELLKDETIDSVMNDKGKQKMSTEFSNTDAPLYRFIKDTKEYSLPLSACFITYNKIKDK